MFYRMNSWISVGEEHNSRDLFSCFFSSSDKTCDDDRTRRFPSILVHPVVADEVLGLIFAITWFIDEAIRRCIGKSSFRLYLWLKFMEEDWWELFTHYKLDTIGSFGGWNFYSWWYLCFPSSCRRGCLPFLVFFVFHFLFLEEDKVFFRTLVSCLNS